MSSDPQNTYAAVEEMLEKLHCATIEVIVKRLAAMMESLKAIDKRLDDIEHLLFTRKEPAPQPEQEPET